MRTSIRVASFNIQHGRTADGSAVDVARMARAAAGLHADVLALQEVDVDAPRSGFADEAAAAAGATGMAHVFGRATTFGGGGRYGNALLVRGDITDVEIRPLPRRGRSEPRSVTVATAHLEDLAVSVAATHLSIHRSEAFEQLRAALGALAERPLPRVLLGDLNLLPTEVEEAVRAAGLALAGGPPTFPAAGPTIRIDHVAVAGLDIGAVEVVHTRSSDHRALVVELCRS